MITGPNTPASTMVTSTTRLTIARRGRTNRGRAYAHWLRDLSSRPLSWTRSIPSGRSATVAASGVAGEIVAPSGPAPTTGGNFTSPSGVVSVITDSRVDVPV